MKLIPQIRFKGFTDDWEERKLSEIGKIVTGNTPNTSNKDYYNGDFLFVSPADIQENRYVNKTTTTLTELGFKTGRLVPKGATLFVSIGSTIGKTGQSICDVITNQQINSVISFSDYDDDFIYTSILNSSTKIKQLAATQAVPIINKNEFGKSIIKIPSLEEQQKIGAFFKQLDDIIALHQRKLDLLKETKKGFLQKMFPKNGEKVPEIRFPGFTEDWEQRKLSEFTERVRGNDGRMNLPTLTMSASLGWMSQEERFSANIAGKEQKNYTLLRKGELSYNHGNSKLAKYGVVFVLKNYDEALVPRVYHSFKVIEGNSFFIEQYFTSKLPDRELGKLVSSGARMDGLLNINYESFINIKLTVPDPKEQIKIGNFFKQLDETITLHQRKLDLLKETKKGFLQKMF
ncbi:restriction endonuclease subunit S [Salmonella enterica]|nr:restriction endonuclease subunit S [Salmonella enterica]